MAKSPATQARGKVKRRRAAGRVAAAGVAAQQPRRKRTRTRRATRDLVVIGASGGGLEAISVLLRGLPAKFPAAVAVVLHRSDRGPNVLASILGRAGPLPVVEAAAGMPIRSGQVYVPPANRHLLIEGERFQVSHGPKENHVRPAVDPLFRGAARHYGARAIGVILSGSLDDGTAGLLALKRRGGVAIVQDPDEALFDGMPRSAVRHVAVDYKVPLADISALLVDLAGTEVVWEPEEAAGPSVRSSTRSKGPLPGAGPVSALTCPACGGALREEHDGEVLRFACHTGHRYGADSLVAGKDEALESALWAALRALHEKAELTRRLADRARDRGDMGVSGRYRERMADMEKQIRILRDLVERS